jgi:DAK2 domain fusion protein YloV
MALFAQALRNHRDEINSLNVFPVPDGDTGTNMLLTQEAVERELAELDGEVDTLGALGGAVARASLMGARGNSGVILSQVLRGFFERLPADGPVGPRELAEALRHASDEADRAVARPADGTVLSVLRDAAAAAGAAADGGSAPGTDEIVAVVLDAARASLARTMDEPSAMRDAGVVDAGAKGLVLLFDAMQAALRGGDLTEPVGPFGPVGRHAGEDEHRGPLEFGTEVQYLLEGDDADIPALRRRLEELGDSVVVVGGGGLFNVHVHTNDAHAAVKAGTRAGRSRDVSIVDLATQVTECIGGHARAVRIAEQVSGLVAVAEGEGLIRTFRSLGAVVVPGGPGNNPAVEDLMAAVQAAPAEAVVVLPNHRNVAAPAEQAAGALGKRALLVASLSVPAGLAAAAAFNPLSSAEANAEAMEVAAAACRAGQVARAGRDADTEAGPVGRGEWLGRSEGHALVRAETAAAAAIALIRILSRGGAELVTLIAGAEASDAETAEVAQTVRDTLPDVHLETIRGGQPRDVFLIGVE